MADNFIDRWIIALEDQLSAGFSDDYGARERLRANQINRFMAISPLLMTACVLNAAILGIALNWTGFKPLISVWLGVIAVSSLFWLFTALSYAVAGPRRRVSLRGMRRLSINSGLYAALWGALPLLSIPALTTAEMHLVFTFLAGILGGGCVVLGFVPAAMYTWVFGMALFGIAGLLALPTGVAAILFAGALLYIFVLIRAGQSYGSAFASTALNAIRLREQTSTVEVLLKEYEDGGQDWIWQTDSQHRLVRGARELLEATTLSQQALFDAMNGTVPEAVSGIIGVAAIRAQLTSGQTVSEAIVEIKQPVGPSIWLKISGKPLHDDGGAFLGYRGVVCNVTDAMRNERHIKWLALHDTLTGLANRTALNRYTSELFRSGRPVPCTLMYLDMDAFKAVNDTMGHTTGDLVLQTIARRLRDVAPKDAHVARIGGDEFVVVLPQALDHWHAAGLAERIHAALTAVMILGERQIRLGCSIGIAISPRDAKDAEGLIQAADLALYAAKGDADIHWAVFDKRLETARNRELALESALRDAVDTGAITLHYQPFFDTRTRKLMGFEALARWEHPELGFIPPVQFIPLAERTGLIARLGAQVLKDACKAATRWPSNLQLAVNLSVAQFRDGRASEAVRLALESSGLPPERLEVEVTEQVFAEDTDQVLAEMQAMRNLGISISLDDFGTGYSSLSYVMKFPVDKLKIDRSFVDLATRDERAHSVLTTMAQLARTLKLGSTVEGVETPEQFAMVQELGFTLCQGYLFSRPVPETELPALMLLDSIRVQHEPHAVATA